MKIITLISILMLLVFTGYSQKLSKQYPNVHDRTLEQHLEVMREVEKWANGSHVMPLDRPLNQERYLSYATDVEEPTQTPCSKAVMWVLLGLGAGLVLSALINQSKN